MLQFLGSEALYRRNSWVGGCISQLVGALQLYVALPGGEEVYQRNQSICSVFWLRRTSCAPLLQYPDGLPGSYEWR